MILKLLIEAGTNKNQKAGPGNWTLLMKATRDNSKQIVEYLVKENVDVNLQNSDGFTASYYAAKVNFL